MVVAGPGSQIKLYAVLLDFMKRCWIFFLDGTPHRLSQRLSGGMNGGFS